MSQSIGATLVAILRDTPQYTALVGMRTYPSVIPQKAFKSNPVYPCVVYHEIDGSSDKHLRGITGFAESRVQFDCYAQDAGKAAEIRQVLRLTLQPFRNTVGDVFIHNVEVDTVRGDVVPPADGSDRETYIKQIDFLVQHSEPVALGA